MRRARAIAGLFCLHRLRADNARTALPRLRAGKNVQMGLFSRLRPSGPAASDGEQPMAAASEREALRLIDQGNAIEHERRTAEALELYDAAIRMAPNLARAHLNRGNALLELGNTAGALEAYAAAIARDPDYAGAYYNLGNAHLRSGQHEGALDAYRKTLALKPDFVDAEVASGCVLEDLGRPVEAVECYRRALGINPLRRGVRQPWQRLRSLGQPRKP